MKRYRLFINGEWCAPDSGRYFHSVNPYTDTPWARIPAGNANDVIRAVDAAATAFRRPGWAGLTPTQRGALLRRLGDLAAEQAAALAEVEVRDNGKLYSEMHAQCRYIPQWYHYFGGLADKVEGAVIPTDKDQIFNYTLHEPLGVVGMITPWNSPLLLLSWKLAPALAAGCTVVIKPSESASASTLEFMKLVRRAGFPPGVVNVVTGFGADVGAPLVAHPLVAKIAFTGSESVGQRVYESSARRLRPVTLELGGKSANIVFADADLDNAVRGAIAGIFAATGQTCIAGSRLLLQESIHDEFVRRLLKHARRARLGDPMKSTTQVGPITTPEQYRKVLDYIALAKKEGARCVLGGRAAKPPVSGARWFIEPTIFVDVHNRMRIAQEEVFGPVLSVIPFRDDAEAVAIANDVLYGLAAGIWTSDMSRALTLSRRLEAGTVWVNTYRAVSFTSPFGGYKRSGIGRENGIEAIHEYLQTKSVWINTARHFPEPFVMR